MRWLTTLALIVFHSAAMAEERNYGSFVYSDEVPNVLFLFDEIRAGDSFEFRKALRNHNIQTLVLGSPGGSVWEGLTIGGTVFDKGLRTYIPNGARCVSACSFIFFGGKERLISGNLGVHQFASSNANQEQPKGEVQSEAQYTVSEIIGFLNEFSTPPFVLERMFEGEDVYWFDSEEMRRLESIEFDISNEELLKIETFIGIKKEEYSEIKGQFSFDLKDKDLVKKLQTALNAVGCSAGPVDGEWGSQTLAASVLFAKTANLPHESGGFIDEVFLNFLASAEKGFCPPTPSQKAVPKPNTIFLSRYWSLDANCSGKKVKGNAEITWSRSTSAVNYYLMRYQNSVGQFWAGEAWVIANKFNFA